MLAAMSLVLSLGAVYFTWISWRASRASRQFQEATECFRVADTMARVGEREQACAKLAEGEQHIARGRQLLPAHWWRP